MTEKILVAAFQASGVKKCAYLRCGYASPMMKEFAEVREKSDLHMKAGRYVSDTNGIPQKGKPKTEYQNVIPKTENPKRKTQNGKPKREYPKKEYTKRQ